MDRAMFWVAVIAIILPLGVSLVGWIINKIVTARIDALEKDREDDRKEFYVQLNGLRGSIEKDYVLQKLYDQKMQSLQETNDERFKSMIKVMETQFQNVEDKIDGIKELINDKFNNHNKGG